MFQPPEPVNESLASKIAKAHQAVGTAIGIFKGLVEQLNKPELEDAHQVVDAAIAIVKDLVEQFSKPELKEDLQQLVKRLGTLSIDGSNIFFSTFLTDLLRDDSAHQERHRFYRELGQVLTQTLNVSSKEGLLTSYYLIGQEDLSDLVEDGVIPAAPEALLEQAKNVLVEATIRYTNQISEKPRIVRSVIEFHIAYPTNAPRGLRKVEIQTDLDRDVLPSDIREALIRGDKPVTYQLFPQERS